VVALRDANVVFDGADLDDDAVEDIYGSTLMEVAA
jgi:hypothetical protein